LTVFVIGFVDSKSTLGAFIARHVVRRDFSILLTFSSKPLQREDCGTCSAANSLYDDEEKAHILLAVIFIAVLILAVMVRILLMQNFGNFCKTSFLLIHLKIRPSMFTIDAS
jgi:hypothetical protein